jgi:hypothetical protein
MAGLCAIDPKMDGIVTTGTGTVTGTGCAIETTMGGAVKKGACGIETTTGVEVYVCWPTKSCRLTDRLLGKFPDGCIFKTKREKWSSSRASFFTN